MHGSSKILLNEMERSKRPKIFEQWPPHRRSEPSFDSRQQSRKMEKKQQSLRAEQALEKSLMIVTNIKEFQTRKKKYQEEVKQYQELSDTRLKTMNEITTENGSAYRQKDFEMELMNFNRINREGSRIQQKLECFSLANLANYDPSHTSMEYTREFSEAEKVLEGRVKEIQRKRMKLQEVLVSYQNRIPESKILGDENSFEFCLNDLSSDIQPSSLSDIHMLMMYELKSLKELKEQHRLKLESNRHSFAAYEGIFDSMALMENQKVEMKKDRKWFKDKYRNLTFQTAEQIIPETEEAYPYFVSNMKVYESNMGLLARYNSEVNLHEYAERRKGFVAEVNKYKNQFENWSEERRYASDLFGYHKKLIAYNKKSDLAEKVEGLELERREVQDAYHKCLGYQVPVGMKKVQEYKFRLADQLEKAIKRAGIILPYREELPRADGGSPQKLKTYLDDGNKLHKYVDFFLQMKYKEKHERISYLRNNRKSLEALTYQMTHDFRQKQKQSMESLKYKAGLQYSTEITQYLEAMEKASPDLNEREGYVKAYFRQCQRVGEKGMTAIPIGLESALFNFSHDLVIKRKCLQFMKRHEREMKSMSERVSDEIGKHPDWKNYVETRQIPEIFLSEMSAIRREQFYLDYLRKISAYSPQTKADMLEEYWSINEGMVVDGYRPVWEKYKLTSVDNKVHFFSCKILTYLACSREREKIKVPKITELVNYYLDFVDRYEHYRWDQGQFLLQVVKQRLLLRYLRTTLNKYSDAETEMEVIENVNKCCMLMYETNCCIQAADSLELQTFMKHGLQIQEDLINFSPTFNSKNNIQLQEKCKKVLLRMKKMPLVLGNKLPIKSYIPIIDFNSKLSSLKQLKNEMSGINRFEFLSSCYSQSERILDIKNSLEQEFQPSDVVSMWNKNKKMIYLESIADNLRSPIKSSEGELIDMMALFRRQPVGSEGGRNSVRSNEGGMVRSNEGGMGKNRANDGQLQEVLRELKKQVNACYNA